MNALIQNIRELARALAPELIKMRRHLHAHPELSYHEKETAAYVVEYLRRIGLQPETGIGGHGIVAFIEGMNPHSACIALRADMDALPITEANEVDYKSKNPGVMHACGHDVHTTCLLGAAYILNQTKNQWNGKIQLIFQPAEEVLPGGASLMIKEGIFEKSKPRHIIGQHVYPELPAGSIGLKPGAYMASTDEIYVTVTGVGGHGAKPHKNIDPVLISAHLIIALQQVVSRWAHPAMPSVLSFGKVLAHGATNIIPNEVKIEGTFRTFDEQWRNEAHDRMVQLATSIAEGMGGKIDFRIERGYPVLHNDPAITAQCKAAAIAYLGENKVHDLELRMTAEDFAYYSQMMPGCFYRLGTADPNTEDKSFSVHHPRFDIDEHALEIGSGLMAWMALQELSCSQ
jgi:amidohydrolase